MTVDIRRLSVDGTFIARPSGDRQPIDANDRETFGRYNDVYFFKISADCRPIIKRLSPDVSPMTKPLTIGGSVNKTLTWVLRPKTKKSADHTKAKFGADVGRHRPMFPMFAHRPSGDGRFG